MVDDDPHATGDEDRPPVLDLDQLLACIPDESSDGLSRDDLLRSYRTGRSEPLGEDDFDAALNQLEASGRVRTTTKRRSGTQVRFFLRTSR
jgi:hypothetical protein